MGDHFMTKHCIGIERRMFDRSLSVWLSRHDDREIPPRFMIFNGEGWAERAECAVADPSFHLTEADAVRLMDDLWHAGIRPSQEGSEGQLAALTAHKNDLRALLWHKEGLSL